MRQSMTLRVRIILLGLLAVNGLGLLFLYHWLDGMEKYRAQQQIAEELETARHYTAVVHELQRERGRSAGYLATPSQANRMAMNEQQRRTDARLAQLSASHPAETLRQLAEQRAAIADRVLSRADAHAYYAGVIETLLDDLARFVREVDAPQLRDHLEALLPLAGAKESLGQLRAELNYALSLGTVDGAASARIARLDGRLRDQLRRFRRDASERLVTMEAKAFAGATVEQVLETVARAADYRHSKVNGDPDAWFRDSTAAIDKLRAVEMLLLDKVRADVEANLVMQRRLLQQTSVAIGLASLLAIALAGWTVRQLLRDINRLVRGVTHVRETGDYSHRLATSRTPEIETVTEGFNQLLDTTEQLLAKQETLARTDALTGIANRLHFDETLHDELARRDRHPAALTLLLLDIDHFKPVNDTFGHETGDAVLRDLTRRIGANTREGDLFARWGGEEFVLLLPNEDPVGAEATANKLRTAIAEEPFPTVGRITVSIGVAAWQPGDTADSLYQRADEALYRAKDGGRNRVESSLAE